jgi:flagellar biosynthesis/type III secretory pathway protein FliH
VDRVIKAGVGQAVPGRRITAATWLARDRAEAVLEAAGAEARSVVAAARTEAERLRQAAAEEGRQAAAAAVAAARVAAAAARTRALGAARDEALDLAVEMARRLLGRELALHPDAVRAAASEALQAVAGRHRVALRLHPSAAAALGRVPGALPGPEAGVVLVADPALAPGDVWLECEAGAVDGRLEVRLAALRRALAEEAA